MFIKPIETEYQGYKFRSRLEARWAVFLDAAGIKYEYEKEGFELGDAGRYLPDFYLPDIKTWLEIKPNADIQKVYLAGKVCPDWRKGIAFPGSSITGPDMSRILHGDDGDLHAYNSEWQHGLREYHAEVLKLCFEQIRASDVFFAWINSPDCHGTLVELGYAKAIGKPVYIGFDNKVRRETDRGYFSESYLDIAELWFAAETADAYLSCDEPQVAYECLVRTHQSDKAKWEALSNHTQMPVVVLRGEAHRGGFVATEYDHYNWNLSDFPCAFRRADSVFNEAFAAAKQARFEHGQTPTGVRP